MNHSLISIFLLVSIYYTGISQISPSDSLKINDTLFYPDPDPNFRIEYETMPEFPGGNDSLIAFAKRHMIYPQHLVKDSMMAK